jgi:hypothetical protein
MGLLMGSNSTNGSSGLMAAMAVVVAPLHPPALSDLLANKVFMAGFLAFAAAQIGKIFTERYKRGYWSLKVSFRCGGTI